MISGRHCTGLQTSAPAHAIPTIPTCTAPTVGSLDFYLAPELSERTRALFELNFKVGTTGDLVTALERAQLGYQFGDAATLWLGRFHTPYGYYNTAFHHGQQISTSLRRPQVVQFETTGGVMPAHTVGLWLAGAPRTDAGRFTYDVYVGNAPRIAAGVLDSNNAGNPHGDAIYGGNFGFLPAALDGFKVGVSAFTAKIEDNVLPTNNRTHVNNYGVYAVYDTDRWENMAEYYWFDNKDLSGSTGNHRARWASSSSPTARARGFLTRATRTRTSTRPITTSPRSVSAAPTIGPRSACAMTSICHRH